MDLLHLSDYSLIEDLIKFASSLSKYKMNLNLGIHFMKHLYTYNIYILIIDSLFSKKLIVFIYR